MARKTKKAKASKIAASVAVHSDRVWDADKIKDGMLHNYGPEPIPVPETRQELFKILNARGLRIKNQQESSTGPELPHIPELPHVREALPPLTEYHARAMEYMERIWLRYYVAEGLWCEICGIENDPAGIRYSRNGHTRRIRLECRCGIRNASLQTDMSVTASDAITLGDKTAKGAELLDQHGNRSTVATSNIQPDDARIIQRYFATLRALRISNDLFCGKCGEKCEKLVTDDKIAFACACSLRHWATTVN